MKPNEFYVWSRYYQGPRKIEIIEIKFRYSEETEMQSVVTEQCSPYWPICTTKEECVQAEINRIENKIEKSYKEIADYTEELKDIRERNKV